MRVRVLIFWSLLCVLCSLPAWAEELLLRLGPLGSTAVMTINGSAVVVTVREVSDKARQAGVHPGKILFQGQRNGDALEGTAWDRRPGCPEYTFRMRGSMVGDSVTLTGEAPTFIMPGCTPFVTKTERYSWEIVSRPASVTPPGTSAAQANSLTSAIWRTAGGSTFLITQVGTEVTIAFEKPNNVAFTNGARQGSVLFKGTRRDASLDGTHHYPYATACPPAPFAARGRIDNDDRISIQTRAVTNYDLVSCRINATSDFSINLERAEPAVASVAPPAQAPATRPAPPVKEPEPAAPAPRKSPPAGDQSSPPMQDRFEQYHTMIVAMAWIIGALLILLSMIVGRDLPKPLKTAILIIVPVAVNVALYVLGIKLDITVLSVPLVAGFSLALIYSKLA
jgi:hypothetical protein